MPNSHHVSRYLYPALATGIVMVALLLLVLLAEAAGNTEFFDKYFSLLYQVNLVVGVSLVLIVGSLIGGILMRLRQKRFGTRLMAKLALFFGVVGVLPGAILYLVSMQFVSRSIETWFDVRVESALEAGLNLGRTAMETSLDSLRDKARVIAAQLAMAHETDSDAVATLTLSRLREQFDLHELVLLTASGRVIASSAANPGQPLVAAPTPQMYAQARGKRGFGAIESLNDFKPHPKTDPQKAAAAANATTADGQRGENGTQFILRALARVPGNVGPKSGNGFGLPGESLGEERFLQVVEPVPQALARDALAVQNTYREYQEIALGRTGLRKMYLGTLTLALFLAVFVAVTLALLLGRQLARPLLLLLRGTQEVAEGDLSPKPVLNTTDELGQLTRQFNQMTRQLAEARSAVERNRNALQESKAHLESILANLTAGVFVFDHQFRLTIANGGAERILQYSFAALADASQQWPAGIGEFLSQLRQAFDEQEASADLGGTRHWQKQIELPQAPAGVALTLLARGTRLPSVNDGEQGYAVVFDDISDVISAQRSIAWGEVARRLAHEIKNPLTPIQLSAERLQMKLSPKLDAADAEILKRSATTIVNQVSAMKRMVDDFRNYAQVPPAKLQPLQLNDLVAEVLNLYGIDDVVHCQHPVLVPRLATGLPAIEGDLTQLRQVIHNLLQNAQDAVADNLALGRPAPCVTIQTELTGAGLAMRAVRLTVADNGPGFTPAILQRAFEPYVTTKPKGTGLGLAMVKKIADEHGARIELRNRGNAQAPEGAQISVLFTRLAAEAAAQPQHEAIDKQGA